MIVKKDRTGVRYGRLLVVGFSHFEGKNVYWDVRCACGTNKVVMGNSLQCGHTKSCGCLVREIARNLPRKITHGMSKSRTYRVWSDMKQRCLNKNKERYFDYGGRGIKVCDRWLNFENFYEDMGDAPDTLTIERVDNNEGYSKSNCRWTTTKDQSRNKRNNITLKHNNKSLIASDWAKETGISKSTILERFHKGLPVMEVLMK